MTSLFPSHPLSNFLNSRTNSWTHWSIRVVFVHFNKVQLSCNLFTCLFGMYTCTYLYFVPVQRTWQLIVTTPYHLSSFIFFYLLAFLFIDPLTHLLPIYPTTFSTNPFIPTYQSTYLPTLSPSILDIAPFARLTRVEYSSNYVNIFCHDFSLSIYIFYSKAFLSLSLSLFSLLSVIFFVLSKLFFDFDFVFDFYLLRSKKGDDIFWAWEYEPKKKEKRGMRAYLCIM